MDAVDQALELIAAIMQPTRARIIVEVDLDPVPGWGNDPEDYARHIQHQLDQTIPHYKPTVRVDDPS